MKANMLQVLPLPAQPTTITTASPSYETAKDSLPLDIIKAIAEDIGRDTAAYIEVMYPEAVKAASSTFKLSLRNHIYNEIMASVRLNDPALIKVRLEQRAGWRKKWVATYRKLRRSKRGATT